MMNQRTRAELVSRAEAYHHTRDCFIKVFRYEGWAGMYRGLSLYLLQMAPEKAIKLATNDFLRDKLREAQHGHLSVGQEVVAGACAGLTNVVFFNPLEIIKIRLQLAGTFSTLKTETVATIARELGLANVYKAATACMVRDVVFCGLYFPLYAHIKPLLADQTGYNTPLSIFTAGSLAGAVPASLVTPIDLIKTRLQVIRRPGQTEYRGVVDCAVKIFREEGGVRAFWKGNLANKLRSAPQLGVTLVLYEFIQRVFFIDFGGSKPSGSSRETPGGGTSQNPDHIGGFAVAQPIFVGMESKFGLFFPKYK